jgi:putative SOS response-associated peptidase YedK
MCGRAYSTYTDDEISFQYLNRRPLKFGPLKPNYNMSPTHHVPVVRAVEGVPAVEEMHWGLIPEWAPEFKMTLSTINARSEGIHASRLYKKAILQRRCIVPVSGFFEWKRDGKEKRPFKISLKDQPIMSFAGIWTAWHAGGPDAQCSFSIMTTAANEFMANIHDRMPVILEKSQFEEWLDPEVHEVDQINAILKPCPSDWLQATEVSTLVNSPRNNRAEVLAPLAE